MVDINQLKSWLQAFLTDGLAVVVGSGLSCAEGLPGMGELAEHLSKEVGIDLVGSDRTLWEQIQPLIHAKGLEPALSEKPPTVSLENVIVSKTAALIVARERSVMTEVFSGKRVLRLTDLIGQLLKPSGGIPIITTNYDRLVEVAVEEAGLGVDTMFVGRFAGKLNERESQLSFCRDAVYKNRRVVFHYKERAIVYKPHGSLDWYLRNDTPIHYSGDLDGATRLIITPGHNKFRNGYQSPFDHHRSKANEAIDRASRYLIVGYGFNDDHLETHLTPAIKSGKPALLITRSLTDAAKGVATTYNNVVALDYLEQGGIAGTRAIIEKSETFFPHIAYWDLQHFVSDVLH